MRLFKKRRKKKLMKLIITCKLLKHYKLLQHNYYLYCLITRVTTELEIGEVLGWTTYPFFLQNISETFEQSVANFNSYCPLFLLSHSTIIMITVKGIKPQKPSDPFLLEWNQNNWTSSSRIKEKCKAVCSSASAIDSTQKKETIQRLFKNKNDYILRIGKINNLCVIILSLVSKK